MRTLQLFVLVSILLAGCMPAINTHTETTTGLREDAQHITLYATHYGDVPGNAADFCTVNKLEYGTTVSTRLFIDTSGRGYDRVIITESGGIFVRNTIDTTFSATVDGAGAIYLVSISEESLRYSDNVYIRMSGDSILTEDSLGDATVTRESFVNDMGETIDRVTGVEHSNFDILMNHYGFYRANKQEQTSAFPQERMLPYVYTETVEITVVEQVDPATRVTYVVEGAVLEVMQTIADNHGGPFKTFLEGCL